MKKAVVIDLKKASLKDLSKFIILEKEFEKANNSLRKNSGYKLKTNIEHKKSFESMIHKKDAYFYFAVLGDEYVGYIFGTLNNLHSSGKYGFRLYSKDKKVGYLDSVIVKKKYRNNRISSLMKDSFLHWLKERRINICQVDVAHINRDALIKYKKWGFVEDKVQMYFNLDSVPK